MSLGGLSPFAFLLGLIGLGALLGALQILRVRHVEVPVATTLFWRQAIEQTRARVFRQRFRHLGVWMFLFLLCGLLWLAFAQPTWGGGGARRTVCVLDGSAGMQRGERFAKARAQLEADVRGLPAGSTEVVFVGGDVRTLLAPGEDALLLAQRVRGLGPQAAPAGVVAFVESLALDAGADLTVRVYGDAALPAPETLPEGVVVARVSTGAPPAADNVGITALGVSPAASGAWDAVDVLIEIRAIPVGAAVPRVDVTLDSAVAGATAGNRTEESAPGRRVVRLSDVPARGQVLRASLRTEGLTSQANTVALDDVAEIVLPRRPVLRIAVAEELRALLEPVLASDPGLRLVASDADGEADVAILSAPEAPTTGAPALVFVPDGAEAHALFIRGPDESPEALLETARRNLALAEIDGAALARATGRVVSVGADLSPQRSVTVWRSLVKPDAGLTTSRAFPLFVAGALRWLGGQGPALPFAAAGEPVHGRPHLQGYDYEAGRSYQPVGDAFTPPVAGRYALRKSGTAVAASLLDVGLQAAPATEAAAAAAPAAPFSFVTFLILLALALLALEWGLYRTGRIP